MWQATIHINLIITMLYYDRMSFRPFSLIALSLIFILLPLHLRAESCRASTPLPFDEHFRDQIVSFKNEQPSVSVIYPPHDVAPLLIAYRVLNGIPTPANKYVMNFYHYTKWRCDSSRLTDEEKNSLDTIRNLIKETDYDAAGDEAKALLSSSPAYSCIRVEAERLVGAIAYLGGNNDELHLQLLLDNALMPADTPEAQEYVGNILLDNADDLRILLVMQQGLRPDNALVSAINTLRKENDFLDWLLTLRQGSFLGNWGGNPKILYDREEANKALEHAFNKWDKTKKLHWLIVVASKIPAGHPRSEEFLELVTDYYTHMQAHRLSVEEQAAYPSLAFYAAQLELAQGNTDNANRLLDSLLAEKEKLSHDAISRITLLRLITAHDIESFMRLAAHFGNNCPEILTEVVFPSSVVSVLNLMPLTTLTNILHYDFLPLNQKRALVRMIWARSVLLKRYDIADSLAPLLMDIIPEAKDTLQVYLQAKGDNNKHHAALLALMRYHKLNPFLYSSFSGNGTSWNVYASTETTPYYIDQCNWWCRINVEDARKAANLSQYLLIEEKKADSSIQAPLLQLIDENELKQLAQIGSSQSYFVKETYAWMRTEPLWMRFLPASYGKWSINGKLPDAIYYAIRATRYGCKRDTAIDTEQAKAIFIYLKKFYRYSDWAKKTPYWYKERPLNKSGSW